MPTATAAGCPSSEDLFVVKMNFRFRHAGHPTYTGTIVETETEDGRPAMDDGRDSDISHV